MSSNFDKVALVTGCSTGFGMLIALDLAASGYHVVATMRDLEKKHDLLREAQQRGVAERIDVRQLDVTEGVAEQQMNVEDKSGAERVVLEVLEAYGRIDVLVNNAGYAAGGFAEEISLQDWRAQFDTNVFGLIAMTRAVLPSMRENRRGRIIQISSISGLIGIPGMSPYNASKFAIEGFSEALRLEMLPYGVYVSVVEPGSYQTAIWQKGLDGFQGSTNSPYATKHDALKSQVSATARSAGDPREVANLVTRIALLPRPSFRYPIGKGIRATVLFKRLLPWRIWEWLIGRSMNH